MKVGICIRKTNIKGILGFLINLTVKHACAFIQYDNTNIEFIHWGDMD